MTKVPWEVFKVLFVVLAMWAAAMALVFYTFKYNGGVFDYGIIG